MKKLRNLIVLDQRNMGMSMRVERSNVDQVRKRIEMNKAKQSEVEKEYNFEERMKELKEEVCSRKIFI
jgi:U4/U6.U5 tri-snRNP component SNU23